MFPLFRVTVNVRLYVVLAVVGILSLLIIAPSPPSSIESPDTYPPDPSTDNPWKSGVGYGGVADIQAAFNHGRSQDNASIPPMALPSQAQWDSMSDNEKALWLVNSERVDRNVAGLLGLHGFESNVTSVAQNYANWLLTNDKWGHNADGKSPAIRLGENPTIYGCYDDDYGLWMENLYAIGQSSGTIQLPLERAIYNWMYNDSGSSWGHRRLILHYPFNDNSPPTGVEGFMGIGRASGGPYTIRSTPPEKYPVAEVIVMNAFDPCADWAYVPTPAGFNKSKPNNGATNQPTSVTLHWNSSSGASSYEYCYDTSNDNACSNWKSNGGSTSKTISRLQKGKKYYWHARAVNPEGWTYSNTSGTAYWNFTTGSGGSPPTARSLYLPIMLGKSSSAAKVLSGRVTDMGVPVQTTVELRFYNGSSESTYATADTNANGEYEFKNLPKLSGNQSYYVRKVNTNNIIYWLAVWNCWEITAASTDPNLYRCDFDLQNVNLLSPTSGATLPLPQPFSWSKRVTTSDSYVFHISDITDNDPHSWSDPPLGYVGSANMSSLPSGFTTGKQYGWWVRVFSPDGWGDSFYYRWITFQ